MEKKHKNSEREHLIDVEFLGKITSFSPSDFVVTELKTLFVMPV